MLLIIQYNGWELTVLIIDFIPIKLSLIFTLSNVLIIAWNEQ